MMVIRYIRLLRTSVKIKIALLLKYVCVLYGSKNLVCTFDMRYFYIHNLAHINAIYKYEVYNVYIPYIQIQLGIKKKSLLIIKINEMKRNKNAMRCGF